MKTLSLCVAVVSALCLGAAWHAPDLWTPIIGVAGLICALTTFRSQSIYTFMKILISVFSTEVVIFGGLTILRKFALLPTSVLEFVPGDSFAVGAAVFSILIYLLSHVPLVRSMMRIADPYFSSTGTMVLKLPLLPVVAVPEALAARLMMTFLVVVNQAQVGILVRINYFNRDWFNALQQMNATAFWYQLFAVFTPWVTILILSLMFEYVVQSHLIVRWRRFLTARYIERWLGNSAHYRMSLSSENTDNPDQRIAEDINRFINGGDVSNSGIYFFTIQLISTLTKVISFSVILWTLSSNFTIPGTNFVLPGFLFWVTLTYTVIGTLLTHLVGRPLIKLFFDKQRYEADFRFGLAREREYAEQIALLGGEPQERRFLMFRFGGVFRNYLAIISQYKWLLALQRFYDQISGVIPFILAAPFYFLHKISLGVMTQTASAFGSVQDGLSFFVNFYKSLAEYRSVLQRLTSFEEAIEKANAIGPSGASAAAPGAGGLAVRDLELNVPNGRPIIANATFTLNARESVLVVGPSGCGKSTLFRALAGVWPYRSGEIAVPAGNRVMLLPQQPYFPIGTLREAVSYPAGADAYDDRAVRDALLAMRLRALEGELDVEDNWGQRLSGGEQQRVALARALLAKPDWLLLDESTSALEEDMEARVYQALADKLPNTTLVSIGHRETLKALHQRSIVMTPMAPGIHCPIPATFATAAE